MRWMWPLRKRVKPVSTRREGWCEDGYERGKFFNWANSLFVIDWSSQWKDLDEGAYKGRYIGFWEKRWGKDTRVKGGCLGSDIDSVITWEALMTRDPNEGEVVVVFLECGYKRADTCREMVGGVRIGNI